MKINLTQLEKIAEGNDSHVYRNGCTVYKQYIRLTRTDVMRYVNLVNRATHVINECKYSPSIPIAGKQFNIRFCGTPILDVSEDIDGYPVTLAPYIATPNLDKLCQHPDMYATFAHSLTLGNKEAEFFTFLNKLFYDELPTRTLDEFLYHIDILSRILDQHFGTFGIYIGKYNTKINLNLEETQITFVITDLSVYIDRLRYEQ